MERASQLRISFLRNRPDLRSRDRKYDDIEGRRARQEGKLSASQCAVTALEAKVVDLEARKLDAEAASFQARHNTLKWQKEAEEAKEKLHNCEW